MESDGRAVSLVSSPAQPVTRQTTGAPGTHSTDDIHKEHFSTHHLLGNLTGRAISNGAVTVIAQFAQFVINMGAIMILARLLTPGDFGLMAMVATVMGFLRIFNDAGLSTATVQREGITHAQVSNLFWTNVALGGFITLLLAVSAPVIAWFYGQPQLVRITLALCANFLMTASTVQHFALLKRQMRFKAVGFIQAGSVAFGALVGVGMAWLKCGYWSLVGMQLATPLFAAACIWLISTWRPQLPTRYSDTRSLLHFGANLTASSFLWSLAKGSDSLLIGKFCGSAALGFYSRAAALVARPVEQFLAPMEAVLIPTLSRLQGDPERYRNTVLRVYEVVAMVTFLFSGLLLALSHPLTLVILGRKWESVAPIFAGFTFVVIHGPLASVASWLLTSQGRGREVLLFSLIASAVTVTGFLVGLSYGPVGVAISYSLSCLVVQLPTAYYIAGRRGPVKTGDLWKRFFALLPVFGIVFGATWLTYSFVVGRSPITQLAVCVPAGLCAGASFIWVYSPTRRGMVNLFSMLRQLKKSRAIVKP